MKKLLTVFSIIFFTATCCAWGQDNDKNSILDKTGVYEEVVTLSGVSQADIFKRAKTWILENMQTDDNNILFDDKEYSINNNGTLKIDTKSTFAWVIKAGVTNFKFHVWSKDGRYKFRIDNVAAHLVVHQGNAIAPRVILYTELEDNKMGRFVKEQINEKITAFVQSFKKNMEAQASDKNKW